MSIGYEEVEFTDAHLSQIDAIDNHVYQMLLTFLCKTPDEFPWQMEYIGAVEDMVEQYLLSQGYRTYRPVIVTEVDGTQWIEESQDPEKGEIQTAKPIDTCNRIPLLSVDNNSYVENNNFRGLKIPVEFHGHFKNCSFYECDFSDSSISATFNSCSIYDAKANHALFTGASFTNSTIAHTQFRLCTFSHSAFSNTSIRNSSLVESQVENCLFTGGVMDGFYMHYGIKAHDNNGLDTVKITLGGATAIEVENHAQQIIAALTTGTKSKEELLSQRNQQKSLSARIFDATLQASQRHDVLGKDSKQEMSIR